LIQAPRPTIIVLQALGGQGKTQVTLELARRVQGKFRGIFWIDSSTNVSAQKDLHLIASKLDDHSGLNQNNPDIETMKRILGSWKDPWMLIFDNYNDLSTTSGFNIQQHIPPCKFSKEAL